MAIKEPNIKDQSQDNKMSKRKKDFLIDLRADIRKDDDDRASWKNKMITASHQRLGVKRVKNTPYPNAPDIPLPETDKLIKKQIPPLVLASWAPKKLVRVRIEQGLQETEILKQKSERAEAAMNMILREKIDWFSKLMLAVNYVKENGHCVFRLVEEYKNRIIHKVINLDEFKKEDLDAFKALTREEREMFIAMRFNLDLEDDDDKEVIADVLKQIDEGEKIIEFDVEKVRSMPNIEIPLVTKVWGPGYTTDISQAHRITYESFLTKNELEDKIDSEEFLTKDLDSLDLSGVSKGETDMIESFKARNEGVVDSTSFTDLYRIQEICAWWKPKKSGRAERWVFTFLADVYDAEEALLKEIPFPFEFEEDGWHYEKHDNESKDPRYYASRGVPEQIRGPHEIMERTLNNMLIRDEMNNTPMWEVLNTSDLLDDHIKFFPGRKLPVQQIGTEIGQIGSPINVDLSSERILQLLKAYVEEYQGSTDQLFRNATNTGGGKTLGEVQEGIRATSGPINVEVISFNNTLTKVYRKFFDILRDRLEDDIFVNGVRVTREDFNFPADVRANGQLEVADKEMSTFKAQQRIMAVSQFTQGGIATLDDYYNAATDWLEKDGIKDPDEFLTDPKVIAQEKITQLQQQLQQLMAQVQQTQQQLVNDTKDLEKTRKTNVKSRIAKQAEAEEAVRNELQPTGTRG